MPEFTWKIKPNGKFVIRTKDRPAVVRAWQAHSDTMDFRRITIGDGWSSGVVAAAKPGVYRGRVMKPETGNLAFYFELVYPSGLGFNYSLSTIMTVRK